MSGSEIEKFREEINAMVGRAYRLGLDEARNRIAELEKEASHWHKEYVKANTERLRLERAFHER